MISQGLDERMINVHYYYYYYYKQNETTTVISNIRCLPDLYIYIYTHTRRKFYTLKHFRKKKNKITKTNKAKQAEKRQERWRNVFITASVLSFIGAFLFAVFGSGEEQEWAKQKPSSQTSASGDDTPKWRHFRCR